MSSDAQRAMEKRKPRGIMRRRSSSGAAGFTLLELIIVLALLSIITVGSIPVARNLVKREREKELRRTLREIRHALDAYHRLCIQPQGQPRTISPFERNSKDQTCYPADLETLVKGITLVSGPGIGPNVSAEPGERVYLLRRIPIDPMTGKAEWGYRSMNDDPEGTSWDGNSVYDVYSLSQQRALDGTWYKDW